MSVPRTLLFLVFLMACGVPASAQEPVESAPQPQSSRALNLLHVSFASLQAADVYTTIRGVNAGAVEANPLMRPFAGNLAGLIAVKAGVTASSILLTRRLAKRHRTAAIVLSAALNSAGAAIVVHNFGVNRR